MTNRHHQTAAAFNTAQNALRGGPSNVVDLVTMSRNLKTEDLKNCPPKKHANSSRTPISVQLRKPGSRVHSNSQLTTHNSQLTTHNSCLLTRTPCCCRSCNEHQESENKDLKNRHLKKGDSFGYRCPKTEATSTL